MADAGEERNVVRCDAPMESWGYRSAVNRCGNEVAWSGTGRKPKYCSSACRSAAFRERKARSDAVEREKLRTVSVTLPREVFDALAQMVDGDPSIASRWENDRVAESLRRIAVARVNLKESRA